MEAIVREKVRGIVAEAIKLNSSVDCLLGIDEIAELYKDELSQIAQTASDLAHRLKPILGYVEAENLYDKLIASGEI